MDLRDRAALPPGVSGCAAAHSGRREEPYEAWHNDIAVIGGIDVNFLSQRTPEEIYARSRAMVERTADRGGYMLGSGNSIPEYISLENYFAMMRALEP